MEASGPGTSLGGNPSGASRVAYCFLFSRTLTATTRRELTSNVLRAGLTGKHVDSQALLEVVDIAVRPPLRIQPLQLEAGCTSYPLPSAEFHLFHLHGQQSQWLPVHTGPGLLLNLGDVIHLSWPGGEIRCARGEALLIPPDCRCRLDGSGERNLYFAC